MTTQSGRSQRSLIAGAATLFHEPANEAASHRDMYVYRCMGGSVWVCNHGANIPCAKGDTRRVLPSVTDYCNENPNQDFVPTVVTGHRQHYPLVGMREGQGAHQTI